MIREQKHRNENNELNKIKNKILKDLNHDKMINDSCYYEINESRIFNENLKPFKQLVLQSFLKKSSFSIKERIQFFSKARKRNEFSRNELYKYVVPVFLGKNYLKGLKPLKKNLRFIN